MGERFQGGRPGRPVAGGKHHGVGAQQVRGAGVGVPAVEFEPAAGAGPGLGDLGAGCDLDRRRADRPADGAFVQLVVDLGEGLGGGGLVQLPLGLDQVVADGLGQAVEVPGVVGSEVLQAEFGVLHRRERPGTGEPAQSHAVAVVAAQQVEEDLGA